MCDKMSSIQCSSNTNQSQDKESSRQVQITLGIGCPGDLLYSYQDGWRDKEYSRGEKLSDQGIISFLI